MPDLLKSVEDGVMKLTLNRPEAMNALSRDMLGEFSEALEEAAGSRDIGCVVVRGAGDRAFTSSLSSNLGIPEITTRKISNTEFTDTRKRLQAAAKLPFREPEKPLDNVRAAADVLCCSPRIF